MQSAGALKTVSYKRSALINKNLQTGSDGGKLELEATTSS